jgi:hypothetical protein
MIRHTGGKCFAVAQLAATKEFSHTLLRGNDTVIGI